MEIDSADALATWLEAGRLPAPTPGPPRPTGGRVCVRDDVVAACADRLMGHEDLRGLVVLGGDLPRPLLHHLVDAGAVVFPDVPDTPVQIYRSLYDACELYAGLDDGGYARTPDARAYAWASDASLASDAVTSLLRAIHDDSMRDGLRDTLAGHQVVGVMGGHALRRGTDDYARAAALGRILAEAGLVVVTGGGPGAMEAANLGAWAPDDDALGDCLGRLATAPDFHDVTLWARTALDAKAAHARRRDGGVRSVGVPTWFYGHEPPNVFGDVIAKFFSNALREDDLLTASVAGIVVLPGAAGTVQEVFQAVTPRYYAPAPVVHGHEAATDAGGQAAPLVLVGHEHWTETLPVWPLIDRMAQGRDMAGSVHLVDDLSEVPPLLTTTPRPRVGAPDSDAPTRGAAQVRGTAGRP